MNDHQVIQRYRVTGRTADRPRSGRPRVTTANGERHLRTVTSSAATVLGQVISRHTVRSGLRQYGIRTYRLFRGMTLTRQHRITLGTSVSTSKLATCTLF